MKRFLLGASLLGFGVCVGWILRDRNGAGTDAAPSVRLDRIRVSIIPPTSPEENPPSDLLLVTFTEPPGVTRSVPGREPSGRPHWTLAVFLLGAPPDTPPTLYHFESFNGR